MRRLKALRAWPALDVWLSWAAATIGFVWALLASSPVLVMGINWDTASYVALYASAQASPFDLPWNSHYGLGPVYAAAGAIAHVCGGTFIDGVRWLGAVAIGVAAFVLARFAQAQRAGASLLWVLLYVFSWGVAQLLFTLEDNTLYLPFAAFALAHALTHVDAWSWRQSAVAGGVGAGGVLISWQAGLYLFPPLYVAAFLGGKARTPLSRIRDTAMLFAAFFGGLLAFVGLFRLCSSRVPLQRLLQVLFSRPSPSFFPRSWSDVGALLVDWRRVLAHLGLGVQSEVAPGPSVFSLFLGLAVMAFAAVGVVWSWRRARRDGHWQAHLAWVSFAAVLTATATYVDLPADNYKRYEFIPLFVCVGGMLLHWQPKAFPWLRLPLAALVIAEICLSVAQSRAYRTRLPQTLPAHYKGHGNEPWFVYFRRLRSEHPTACLFTLPLDDAMLHGRYQLEIPAALWSELPAHQLVGNPDAVADWRVKVNVVPRPNLGPAQPCEWRAPLQPL